MDTVTIEDVRQAAGRIGSIVHRTPVLTSRTFNKLTGREVYFKCENFQYGGAFKIRGAANMMLALGEERLRNGVVAYSSGNHAQAVAIAARHLEVPATIVMPDDAPRSKVAATQGYGAKVVMYDRLKEDRVVIGSCIAKESGASIVPPFDHPMIAAGQGTAVLELLNEVPGISALAVCIGGGGLISGCSVAAHGVNPKIRVFGVEPELGNDTYLSIQQGHPVKIAPPETIADGLRAQSPGEITFPLIRSHVEQVLLVSEDEIRDAMRFFLTRMKIVVEPSGAVAAAAVMQNRLPTVDGPVGVVISGGNVDLEMLAQLS
jgi:threonine dehydratase